MAFRVRPSVTTTLDHPLVAGPALQETPAVFDTATPVPALSEIPSGFDAIFQFTTPLLSDYLGRLLGRSAYTIISYDTGNLSPDTKQEILMRIQAALQAMQGGGQGSTGAAGSGPPIVIIGGGTGSGTSLQVTELPSPLALRITSHSPAIQLAPFGGGAFDAGADWVVSLEVGVPEPAPGAGGGFTVGTPVVNVGFTPGASGGGTGTGTVGAPVTTTPGTPSGGTTLRFIPLTQGTAETSANVRVNTSAPQYQAWARLDFTGTDVQTRSSGDALFTTLLNDQVGTQLTDGIQQSLALIFARTDLNITPRTALGGILQQGEQLAGPQSFRVTHATGFGNRPFRRVLSLCVNTGPGNVTGDTTMVRAFVDDRNFGYYLSESIVRAAIGVRVGRVPLPAGFTATIPLDMELSNDPGVIVHGSGRIQYRLLDVADILFDVTTVDLPDAIRISGSGETTLLEAWNERNQRIQDLGSYAAPDVKPYVLRIYPFGGVPPLPRGPAQQFFEDLVARILEPLDRPAGEVIRLTEMEGEISAPLQALFVRARLSF